MKNKIFTTSFSYCYFYFNTINPSVNEEFDKITIIIKTDI